MTEVNATYGPADLARVAEKPPTTVGAWLREENQLKRSKPEHVNFVRKALEFLGRPEMEEYVWRGVSVVNGVAKDEMDDSDSPSVVTMLLDFLERHNIPPDERQKARRALDVILGL